MFCEPQHCDQTSLFEKKPWAAAPNMPPTVTGSPITANIVNNLQGFQCRQLQISSVPRDQLCLSKYQLKTNSDIQRSCNNMSQLKSSPKNMVMWVLCTVFWSPLHEVTTHKWCWTWLFHAPSSGKFLYIWELNVQPSGLASGDTFTWAKKTTDKCILYHCSSIGFLQILIKD